MSYTGIEATQHFNMVVSPAIRDYIEKHKPQLEKLVFWMYLGSVGPGRFWKIVESRYLDRQLQKGFIFVHENYQPSFVRGASRRYELKGLSLHGDGSENNLLRAYQETWLRAFVEFITQQKEPQEWFSPQQESAIGELADQILNAFEELNQLEKQLTLFNRGGAYSRIDKAMQWVNENSPSQTELNREMNTPIIKEFLQRIKELQREIKQRREDILELQNDLYHYAVLLTNKGKVNPNRSFGVSSSPLTSL
jgi:hypothetical protein